MIRLGDTQAFSVGGLHFVSNVLIVKGPELT